MAMPGHRLAIGLFTTVLTLWIVAMAALMRAGALPAEASGTMLAVFPPGTEESEVFARLTRAEARIVRPSSFGFIWIVTSEAPGLAGRLRANGAIGAYRDLPISPTIAGCFALADAKAAEAFGP